jgi:soluble lytic murein transglycosylase-like protein
LKNWVISLPWKEIYHASKKHNFDPYLIGAIVMQESAGDPMATRFEPGYRWLYQPEIFAKQVKTTIETEENHQKTSWGLMQVMGAVARERGFANAMPALCDVEVNLDIGCRHLAWLAKRYDKHGINAVIASFNAGSPRKNGDDTGFVNQSYVDSVNEKIREMRRG